MISCQGTEQDILFQHSIQAGTGAFHKGKALYEATFEHLISVMIILCCDADSHASALYDNACLKLDAHMQ